MAEFAKSEIPAPDRDDARELIQSTIDEIEKPKPSKLSLKALLNGVATTVQTLGTTSEAYKAVTVVLAALGITAF